MVARVIEHIIYQLERGTKMCTIGGHRILRLLSGAPKDSAQTRGGFEELCGLVANYPKVTVLIQVGIAAVHKLKYFAFRDHVSRIGEHPKDFHVFHRDHHLESA